MRKICSLFNKISSYYENHGFTESLKFIGWLSALFIEKAVICIEEIISIQQAIYSLKQMKIEYLHRRPDRITTLKPLVTFILPVVTNKSQARATIKSLQAQLNPNWECLVFLENALSPVNQTNVRIKEDRRVHFCTCDQYHDNNHVLKASITRISGQWAVITQSGDRFDPNTVDQIYSYSGDILYWDEDRYKCGIFFSPFYKPDWSPELWLSVDILRCAAIKASYLCNAYAKDRTARLIPNCVGNTSKINHLARVLTHCSSSAWKDPHCIQNHMKDVNSYIKQKKYPINAKLLEESQRIKISTATNSGKVSIIIPNKNNLLSLHTCIQSILEKTITGSYEIIIVDNNSSDESTLNYYCALRSENGNTRIIELGEKFNFSNACNAGARVASGDILLLLNNDTEVISENWLENLKTFIKIKGVGVVGANLLYPDGKIQHAGIVIGLEGHASHILLGSPGGRITPYGLDSWYRNVSAVTAACMMIRKSVYDELHGFDEGFQLIFSDVDFCLRAINKGYRVVYNPDVQLIHHEGISRGKHNPKGDIELGYQRFLSYIKNGDPFLNSNISRAWRKPTFRRTWEQQPDNRVKGIIQYHWY